MFVAHRSYLMRLSGTGPFPGSAGAWTARTYPSAAIANLIACAVSQGGDVVYVARADVAAPWGSNLWAFDVARERYGATPIYATGPNLQIRGVIAAPLAAGAATPTRTQTPTSSPTPSVTPSPYGVPLPPNAFVVVSVGDGQGLAVPNVVNDLLAPVTVSTFFDCGQGCSAAQPERTLTLPSTLYTAINRDAYGNYPLTLNTGAATTTLTGRLVPAADNSRLAVTGFNGWSTSTFVNVANAQDIAATSREASFFTLLPTGRWNITFPCMTATITRPANSPYACDLMNAAELPFTVALGPTGTSHAWFSAGQAAGATPYGIKYFTPDASGTLQPVALSPVVGLADRSDYRRVQAFGGELYYFTAAGGERGESTFWRIPALPTPDYAGWSPSFSAPLFTAAGAGEQWSDFAIASRTVVYTVSPAGGLTQWAPDATGEWKPVAQDVSVTDTIAVGVSNDAATVYVVTSKSDGTSGVHAWDVASQAYTNQGAPVVVAPPGFQFRGVAGAPILRECGVGYRAGGTGATPTQRPRAHDALFFTHPPPARPPSPPPCSLLDPDAHVHALLYGVSVHDGDGHGLHLRYRQQHAVAVGHRVL